MVSADGLRRGKLSSAGIQLVCPHRCTAFPICKKGWAQPGSASEQKKQPPRVLTWCCSHYSDLHTCIPQQNRISLLTSLAKISEINRENVLSKSQRLSGLECLFLQSRGDGAILFYFMIFFCARKKPEDYFFLRCPKTPQGCLSPIVLVKYALPLCTLQGNAFKSLEDPARRGEQCPYDLRNKCTHRETIQ